MTSNQIAFEAAMIQKQANEWLKQHNDEYRAETRRHNQEMESLQENAVKAQEHGNKINEDWNRWQQQWMQDYQAKYREYELAQEDKKIAIQEELARLEDRKVTAEESYKAAQEANLVYMQGIASDQLNLDKAWKDYEKQLSTKQFELSEFQAKVKNKEVEYTRAMQHEQNLINANRNIQIQDYNYALLNWEREKFNKSLNNQYVLARLNYDVGMKNVEVQQRNLELYQKKVTAENFQSYASGLFGKSGIIPGSVESVSKFMPFLGGIYGTSKITKSVAEAILFK
jgi:hypothetical protein